MRSTTKPTLDEAQEAVSLWLQRFEAACSAADPGKFLDLFEADCHWRDLLAFTWAIETLGSRQAIADRLASQAHRAGLRNVRIDTQRAAPHWAMRAGVENLEAFFRFDTAHGEGAGVVRFKMAETDHALRAWTLLTTLETLQSKAAHAAPAKAHARDFRGPNWLDLRRQSAAYADHDPAVIVVGAGQAGLAIAARLGALGIDTLVVDRHKRVGDNWRHRYHALTLHNQTHVNHLPFMPFPPTWPIYIPKDKLASWLESYAEAMEINCWTETEFAGSDYDTGAGRWSVTLRSSDGRERQLHPRHIVLATGVSGIPHMPEVPGLRDFRGTLLHASQYQDGETWHGKRAIVIGSGNSGHDIAQDLYSGGADVTLVQRSPTMVVNLETAQLPYALYSEGMSTDDCDLVTASMPLALARETHKRLTADAARQDADLLAGLRAKGFHLDFGEDGTGWQFKYLTRGGGYYFNVGCSELIVEGKVHLLQFADMDGFCAEGARMKNGAVLKADLVVLATGYKGQEHLVQRLFGERIAARVGPIWGFGDGQELRNMYTRTPQPGLYFIAGSLAQCRIYSKYLALQIAALEAGLLPRG